ncbi:MAG: hypothetical protein JW829_19135 [Pirellulales bacterium]|nr:hypothetical protein [Pirellulales bacterium]
MAYRIGFPILLVAATWIVCGGSVVLAHPYDPGAADYTGHRGATFYVSKRGDNSDGTTWERAFHTIQAALLAVPDDRGGHRVIVRPDTYVEANLWTGQKGAAGSYNLLLGDFDGRLGSGATGWVIIDAGVPDTAVRQRETMEPGGIGSNPGFVVEGAKGPETGLKSVDWWGPWRSDPTFSAICWDRWIFRRLYATGAEGGMGWDLTTQVGAPFSAIVDECVGIGRFSGAAAIGQTLRPGEPVLFSRSYFACLDVWGDAGGVYVRSHEESLPETPGVIFDDCTIVGPDNALHVGYPGFIGFSRILFKRCRLLVLNFSQPHGTPSTGILYTDLDAKYVHIDLEDCQMMGYRPFGSRSGEQFGYSTKGTVSAYVQYRQAVPDGFVRTAQWPADLFAALAPPVANPGPAAMVAPPRLVKLPVTFGPAMENTPVVFNGRPLLVYNDRDDTKNKTDGYTASMYLLIKDLATGDQVARFGQGHSFASAFVDGQTLHVFASEGTNHDWFQSLYRFSSKDLLTWEREIAIERAGDEHLFNCSVCRDGTGYVMAYESNLPVEFCFKFARSADLVRWEKIPGLVFQGTGNEYSACPALRYVAPYYYAIYLHAAPPGKTGWVSFMARSRDLAAWELSPRNPILEAGPGEGINNSDVDLFEFEGSTYLFYATGDQATWGAVRVAMFPGTLPTFFDSYFPASVPTVKVSAGEPVEGGQNDLFE